MTSKDRIKELQVYVGSKPDGIIGAETLKKFSVKLNKSRAQTIHFFAQIHHESGGFTIARENMNYRAPRIMEIFGVGKHSAKVTHKESLFLAGKPYELAERVYGLGNPKKAKELGNIRPGDGYKFRGGGALQCTGGADYERYGGKFLYYNPDRIGDSSFYFTTAINEFDFRNTWSLAKDLSETSLLAVTRRVNGGINGLPDRRNKLAYYNSLWDITLDNIPPKLKSAITLANLNLRNKPVNGSIITVIPKNTQLDIIETLNGWSEVKFLNKTGWVSNYYIK